MKNKRQGIIIEKYLEAFFTEITWQFSKDMVKEIRKCNIEPSDSLKLIYPQLYKLLIKAKKIELILKNGEIYRLFCWESVNGIGGWLCKPSLERDNSIRQAKHRLVIGAVGNIIESFGFSDIRNDWLCNMNFVFGGDEVIIGIENWEPYLQEMCEYAKVNCDIDMQALVVIAEEANGNLILNNCNTDEILMFAPDHFYDFIEPYKDFPKYTFYTLHEVDGIIDYVEKIAEQWLSYLEL